jgi:hypothetical protein
MNLKSENRLRPDACNMPWQCPSCSSFKQSRKDSVVVLGIDGIPHLSSRSVAHGTVFSWFEDFPDEVEARDVLKMVEFENIADDGVFCIRAELYRVHVFSVTDVASGCTNKSCGRHSFESSHF